MAVPAVGEIGEIGEAGVGLSRTAGLLGKAGSYADLSKLAEVGDDIVGHHMPQLAIGFTSKEEGGALAITKAEHFATRTYGGKGVLTAAEDAGKPFRLLGILAISELSLAANTMRDCRN